MNEETNTKAETLTPKDIVVSIRVFPDWVCTGCGATGKSRTLPGYYPGSCPECGEEKCRSYSGPERTFPYVGVTKGRYDWLHPAKEQWSYTFKNVPSDLTPHFVVDDYYDPNVFTALELARQLKETIDAYLVNSDKAEIAKVVKWLELHEEEHDMDDLLWKLESTEWQVWRHYQEVERLRRVTKQEVEAT